MQLKRTRKQINNAKYMRKKMREPGYLDKVYKERKEKHKWVKRNDHLQWRVRQLAWLIKARQRSIELAMNKIEKREKELLRLVKEREVKAALLKERKKQERERRKTVVNTGEVSQSARA